MLEATPTPNVVVIQTGIRRDKPASTHFVAPDLIQPKMRRKSKLAAELAPRVCLPAPRRPSPLVSTRLAPRGPPILERPVQLPVSAGEMAAAVIPNRLPAPGVKPSSNAAPAMPSTSHSAPSVVPAI